ncbi:MAG TPA: choice-of-anchor tandem repeat GloVer-containing protein [Methylocella sp.]|nr:choice-of-anchor tandem repeat GloVer-containing protein [Methylocella sp.]
MAAPKETVLYSFTGGIDGGGPNGGLILDRQHKLYGTTEAGGKTSCLSPGAGCGVVFKLVPYGYESILHSFLPGGTDGDIPTAGLVADHKGNLYGTTMTGAVGGQCAPIPGYAGCGAVYKLAPDRSSTVLYHFRGGSDGGVPSSGLLADRQGNLYGTTTYGGGSAACPFGCGTVFKLASDGSETVLHAFNGSDGANPMGGLIGDSQGNLYGTAAAGGASYDGVVFKLASDGTSYKVLHAFDGGDGEFPVGALIADGDGYLYGSAQMGTTSEGVVFKLATDGTSYEVLHAFNGSDGAFPNGDLLADASGTLFGTTAMGGAENSGVVFQLARDRGFSVLYAFTGGNDGAFPSAGGLTADSQDNLYGATLRGGKYQNGVVYKLQGSGFIPAISPRDFEVAGTEPRP